jgi:hypothetical protein
MRLLLTIPRLTMPKVGSFTTSVQGSVIYLFVLAPVLFALIRVNINNFAFAYGILILMVCLSLRTKIEARAALFLSIYLAWILVYAIIIPRYYDIKLKFSVAQFLYYLKPAYFFLLGYVALKKRTFDRILVVLLWYLTLGSVVYYLNWFFFVQSAIARAPEAQSYGHFFAIGGHLLRNCSLMLSPLDTSYITFFLSLHFFSHGRKAYAAMAFALMLSTLTRSTVIGWLFGFVLYFFFRSGAVGKIRYLLMFTIILATVSVIFFSELTFLLVTDGSAGIHQENLMSVIRSLIQNPLGRGIGYSGWGTLGMPGHLYSEGSLLSNLLENGFAFLIFYIAVGGCLYRRSRTYLLPIFLGYAVISLLLPIGYSTLFNMLLFTAIGVILRQVIAEKPGDFVAPQPESEDPKLLSS